MFCVQSSTVLNELANSAQWHTPNISWQVHRKNENVLVEFAQARCCGLTCNAVEECKSENYCNRKCKGNLVETENSKDTHGSVV